MTIFFIPRARSFVSRRVEAVALAYLTLPTWVGILGGSSTIALGLEHALSNRSRSFCTSTQPFPFPYLGPSPILTNGFHACNLTPGPGRWPCTYCASSPECAALHHQCYVTFVLHCRLPLPQALQALRNVVFYRRPWPKAPRMNLQPGPQHAEAARRWVQSGIPADTSDPCLLRLRCLPPELLDIVRRFSPHAWLWRFASLCSLSPCVPTPEPPRHVALERIESWTRGDNAAGAAGPVVPNLDERPILIITVDAEGIRTLARVPERLDVCPSVSHCEAYLVEDISSLTGVQVQIKVRPLSTSPFQPTKVALVKT